MEDIGDEYQNIGDEYKNYWETNMFLQTEEFDSWGGLEETFSGYYDSSSPDGTQSSAASKNIVSERNRRKKLNDRLFALRAVVPNISKMDKASIIKDAIDYIQHLHEQERIVQEEIMKLEKQKSESGIYDFDQDTVFMPLEKSKKKRIQQSQDLSDSRAFPIEIIELKVSYVGENTALVSLKCRKRRDTMVKICEVFESLKLNVVTANITAFPDTLFKTLFIQADEEEIDVMKLQIHTALCALNDPLSSMST
ncbi:transcription factor bHLH35 [Lactuca sativa]|uniref:BHLH domain-containing protein n=1 Tax=Lactuca sativa TaxID=4236 RepID=A0A9R1VF32_LACSA|nr:transcription factor bHLH35 [Lactuca sativa]KAJ0203853.1 hypothetical protein LSAT_V11C500258950 [Lactuca sativa]